MGLLSTPGTNSHIRSHPENRARACLLERDATIAFLRATDPNELEKGLDREVVIEHRRDTARAAGAQFLRAFAIPHFFYHVTNAYGIMRNQGIPLTMSDFLGNWVA